MLIFNILGQTLGPLVGGWTEKTEKVEIGQRVHKQICQLSMGQYEISIVTSCHLYHHHPQNNHHPLYVLIVKKLCIKVQGVFLTGTPP